MPGLDDQRKDQVVAGALLANELFRRLDLKELRVCKSALREGIGQAQDPVQLRGQELHQPAEAEALGEIGMERNAGRVHRALLGGGMGNDQRSGGR